MEIMPPHCGDTGVNEGSFFRETATGIAKITLPFVPRSFGAIDNSAPVSKRLRTSSEGVTQENPQHVADDKFEQFSSDPGVVRGTWHCQPFLRRDEACTSLWPRTSDGSQVLVPGEGCSLRRVSFGGDTAREPPSTSTGNSACVEQLPQLSSSNAPCASGAVPIVSKLLLSWAWREGRMVVGVCGGRVGCLSSKTSGEPFIRACDMCWRKTSTRS